jgi:hypothetical protein
MLLSTQQLQHLSQHIACKHQEIRMFGIKKLLSEVCERKYLDAQFNMIWNKNVKSVRERVEDLMQQQKHILFSNAE